MSTRMITATRPMDRIHPVRGPAPVDRSWRNAGLKAQIVELANDLYQQRCLGVDLARG